MQVYIAGPLFTDAERTYLEKIDSLCKKAGLKTYLPHRDAGLFTGDAKELKHIFELDRKGVDNSKIMVAVLDGIKVDDGTAWEMGYAYAKKIPIIGIVNDFRLFDPLIQFNPMIHQSVTLVKTLDQLKEALQKHINHD